MTTTPNNQDNELDKILDDFGWSCIAAGEDSYGLQKEDVAEAKAAILNWRNQPLDPDAVHLLAFAMHAPSVASVTEREEVIKKWLDTNGICVARTTKSKSKSDK